MLSGPVRSSVVLGFVKYRLHLHVNVRLSREISQLLPAPRRNSSTSSRSNAIDRYTASRPWQETPLRGQPIDHYATIYASIEQPRAHEQPRVVEPQLAISGPRYTALRQSMQFCGPYTYDERLRRPAPVLQHPFMFSPYHSVEIRKCS
jgi:hypothetical protein